LLPKAFSNISKRFDTPSFGCAFVAIIAALISGFTPIEVMGDLCSLGTLFAFVMVAIAVMVLRITKPNAERPFKCPAVFVVGTLAVISCSYLLYQLFIKTGNISLIWFALSAVVYFSYTYHKSPLNKKK
jgi:basic amino acid/polyamine antiporter, APA family